ncbi:MAG: hypothetical protein U0414_14660 [Polyangiaceae bacterium]
MFSRLPYVSTGVGLALLGAGIGAACTSSGADGGRGGAAPTALEVPSGAAIGDELVVSVHATKVDGSWGDAANVGAVLRVTAGANVPRDVLLVGGFAADVRASLGPWDGGAVTWSPLRGHAEAALSVEVDPSAAGVPILGLANDPGNDTPLLVFESGDEFEYVMTNEDGGTGFFPTLLLAQWGRPHDIEGLFDRAHRTYQGPDHATLAFDGVSEGTHPRLEITTTNGLVSPEPLDAPAALHVAPMPVAFTPSGAAPREAVLDGFPWLVAAGWLEVEREGKVSAEGGVTDDKLAPLSSWVFLDHGLDGDAKVAFEAEVEGAWYSSLGLYASAMDALDARCSGTGRTAIELPPHRTLADVTAIRVKGSAGAGTLRHLRLLAYDPTTYAVIEGGALPSALPVDPTTSATVIER